MQETNCKGRFKRNSKVLNCCPCLLFSTKNVAKKEIVDIPQVEEAEPDNEGKPGKATYSCALTDDEPPDPEEEIEEEDEPPPKPKGTAVAPKPQKEPPKFQKEPMEEPIEVQQ